MTSFVRNAIVLNFGFGQANVDTVRTVKRLKFRKICIFELYLQQSRKWNLEKFLILVHVTI